MVKIRIHSKWKQHTLVNPTNAACEALRAHPYLDHAWAKATELPIMKKHIRDVAAGCMQVVSLKAILAKTGESSAPGYGREFAANVIEPPTIPRSTAKAMDSRMLHAGIDGTLESQLKEAAKCAEMARNTSRISRSGLRSESARRFLDEQYGSWKNNADSSTSHDAFLTDRAIACMRKFSPSVMAVDYGEIDCSHYGSWSRYVDAIQRTD